jgi:peptidoglycan/xylan/chitin deacetylase (PgdA/CDA1 family)
MAVQRLPALVQTFTDWGCTWLGHGLAATRMVHAHMPLAKQADVIATSLRTIELATGTRPMGWVSQDWGTTPDTARLLAEAGVRYTLDWCNDDQPYWMLTDPPLLAVPLSPEWDDVQCQWLRNLEPRAYTELAASAFDQMLAECSARQRSAVFGLALHPWLCGMPSRIAAMRSLLARLRFSTDVHWIDPGQMAASIPGDPKRGLP